MTILSFRIQTIVFGHTNKHVHVATDHHDMVLAICGVSHEEPVDYMDCPVASRWVLVRHTLPG